MYAQILVAEEMEDLAARVTDAVLAALVDRAQQLTDPGLRSAVGAIVVATREQLSHAPVDPEPLVRAILHGEPAARRPADEADALAVAPAEPVAGPVPVDAPGPPGAAAPAYWPAVPAISDELFAQYAATRPKEHDGSPSGFYVSPQHADQEHTDQEHANEEHADEADADEADAIHPDGSPTLAPEPAADPGLDPTTAQAPGPELNPVHGGRLQTRALRRRTSHRV